MYGLYTTVILMAAAVCTYAATALFPVEEKPAEFANQEGCYLKHLNKVIHYGDYYPEKSCSKYSCYTSNITQVFTCRALTVDENSPCRIVSRDISLDYPDCCPWVMCSTIQPEALTTDTSPVIEQTTYKLEDEATNEAKPRVEEEPYAVMPPDAVNNEDATKSTQAKSLDETPAELLVAQASANQ